MSLELTILMPCLNEAETLATCIRKAHIGAQKANVADYEILIADNGSSDGSQDIALVEGARLVVVPIKGYGAALQTGIQAANGRYIVMGDSDDSYDFSEISPFLERMHEGYQLVMGTRFRGRIMPGAMPFSHQYLGNPILTFIGNLFFRCGLSDFHCGLRAFHRDAIIDLNLKTMGMEFASEMVIRSTLAGLRRTEVPVTLYPDGRSRPPHLRTWRDGWRHLRFMLLYNPRWLFFYPGLVMVILGFMGMLALFPRSLSIGSVVFDVHTMLIAMTIGLAGVQLIFMAIFARVYSSNIGILPRSLSLESLLERFSLGFGLVSGLLLIFIGVSIYIGELLRWSDVGFGPLNYEITLRSVILGTSFVILGLELFFWSFIISLLGLNNAIK